MENLVDFYKNKRVFITGDTGFKGSWLACMLHSMGAIVHGYALSPPSTPSLWELAHISEHIEHTHADILDNQTVQKKIQNCAPDIVLHLAAQSLVRPSYESPFATFNTNVMGTASVLDAVLSTPSVKCTIIVTSDKCYQNIGEPYAYKESDSMGGDDPYSASKGCAELITHAYRQSFFIKTGQALASVRAGNVIGGGDFAKDRLIPDMVRAFAKNESVSIRNPTATRPWQHVLDPLYGYLLLAKKLIEEPATYDKGWNFGPMHQETHTVGEVVKQFSTYWNGSKIFLDTNVHPHEAVYLGLDCTQAHTQLQWQSKLSFTDSITWTADWFLKLAQGENAYSLCMQQIEYFLSLGKEN